MRRIVGKRNWRHQISRSWKLFATILVTCLLGGSSAVQAEVVLPQVLGHNMVVQCKKPVAVWGTATVGEEVSVSFRGQHQSAVADVNGHWYLTLDPMNPSSRPASMTIEGHNKIVLNNILTGEVWFCSGQSNMEYTMRKNSKVAKVDPPAGFKHTPADELQYAHNDQIRIFLALRKPMAKPHPDHEGWSVAEDSALRSFSAAAYFFARKLYHELKVPIGMISNAISGSAIEPWLAGTVTGTDAFTHTPYFDYTRPGKFYPSLIRPVAPFSIRGFLWYQGETNCFMNEGIGYAFKMNALIKQWRTQWGDDSLPFYYVQIAPFEYSKSKGKYPLDKNTLPKFWEAQTLCLKIPHTGMVVINDLPDGVGGIHPTGKWAVGERLAAIALHLDYGKKVKYSGPVYQRKTIQGNQMKLFFTHQGSGLEAKNHQELTYFELAGKDGKYVPAQARIQGDHVVLTSRQVAHPVNARFAWDETAQPNFFNQEGLPAQPFRTDNPFTHVVFR